MIFTLEVIFWLSIFIIFYSYIGYGVLLYLLVNIKRRFFDNHSEEHQENYEPQVTLFVPAFNEKEFVSRKVANSRSLDYPAEKVQQIWVTDGSDDGTPDLLRMYQDVEVYHIPERKGKIAAMNRGMQFVKTPIVIFSDANTELSKQSIREIVKLFSKEKVGCVSGEKRIYNKSADAAAGAGEGLYWKYESQLKKWDAELCSVVGAAGELFGIRTHLWQEVEPDTLLDDFIISLRIAMSGYTIQYSSEAYAMESASADIHEEIKRKIRISAGGIQSIVRLRSLLNVFKYRTLSFQYISHRVLRWILTPLLLLLVIPINIFLALDEGLFHFEIYNILLLGQILFYTLSLIGWLLERKELRLKALFVPYYFFIMNLSVYLGFIRYIKRDQSVNWERARRGDLNSSAEI